jgi:CRISPR-associated endonuclease/helicase Cas3
VTSKTSFFAHSENDFKICHLLFQHLKSVSELARQFATGLPWQEEAVIAGLLHDLGKYGDLFQARLRGEESGLDHWSSGALAALKDYHLVAAALAIEGHHVGLQCAASKEFAQRLRMINEGNSPQGHHIRLSDTNVDRLLNRAVEDGVELIKPASPVIPIAKHAWACAIARMLDVRMLFSCLVDADYLDTESHFNGGPDGKRYRDAGMSLDPKKTTLVLERFMAKTIRSQGRSSDDVSIVRENLWRAVSKAAKFPVGTFSLTAPTGAGKTLAMLQFALTHAQQHGLKRVVLVVPYLSIIEQTAKIYRKVFADEPDHFVLEHHSLAGVGIEQSNSERHDHNERQRRLYAENWDAPIIITTNVQLLESLFSNRPSACRKLHRLRDTVILFDEVQSLPQQLAVPTLAALSHLTTQYNASIVFATATQPAFDTLDCHVRKHASSGWQPQEIVTEHVEMFQRLKRVKATWPKSDESLSWDELAGQLSDESSSQVLCVLNLKRHAHALLHTMKDADGLFHLSTNLCIAHRRAVLEEVRRRLNPANPLPCRLISTQCIEAGVDLDFPLVYRAMAPLDAIAQAAGRCNREGLLNQQNQLGQIRVFEPERDVGERKCMFPTPAYFQATEVTISLLRQYGGDLDINDPDIFRRYYRELYDVSRPVDQNQDLTAAITSLDFPEIAHRYKLIDKDAIQILVPWQPCIEQYKHLRNQAMSGIDGNWIREAQALSVSVYRPKMDHSSWGSLVAARFRRGGESDEWFVLEDPDSIYYDKIIGLLLPQNQQVMIA